jgi:hypothetical protein
MPITYGPGGQPLQTTMNFNALFATSMANYRGKLVDNISNINAFFHELGSFEKRDGGLYLVEDLMYGLAPADTYDGYDPLAKTPTEGITQAHFQWAQASAPVSISGKEKKMNKHRIIDLMASKITQADMGLQEMWAKAFLQGSLAGAGDDIRVTYTGATGASFCDPLPKLVSYTPTTGEVGGIDRSVRTWWQNRQKQSAATTYTGLLAEFMNMYNLCSRKKGGAPNLILCDQITWELLQLAYYAKYQAKMEAVGDYPFPAVKFWNSKVVWDEFVPDVAANAGKGALTAETTKGTAYFLNTQFMKPCSESETDFVNTEPVREDDAWFSHFLWMGGVTLSNAQKQGVIGNIARSLT